MRFQVLNAFLIGQNNVIFFTQIIVFNMATAYFVMNGKSAFNSVIWE